MGYFKLTYQDHPIEVPAIEPSLTLRATSGSWPGQALDEFATLNLRATSPRFFFDPNNDPEDDASQWLDPYLETQWLKIPLKRFHERDYRSLEKIHIDFKGEGTPNSLTGDDWWESPGLIATYSDELFTKAEISFRYDGDGLFRARLAGESLFDTKFDIGFSAPLTVELIAYRNSATAKELLNWFDGYLRESDFAFTQRQLGVDIYVNGIARDALAAR
ncbi:hypothetical protein [Bordetella sp. BOR01]|uniref:hypothetical protein n=1 Tax=Bordetella sp. BOR01 TaxID=2854779 RepID=UPI001C47A242|nr:hypothetical protein [Bordetella sp. BOR01]MBV7481501.1 hypothetical protein [Bordetella sp. BOR01]